MPGTLAKARPPGYPEVAITEMWDGRGQGMYLRCRMLTAREREVLKLIATGHTYAGAAARLGISTHTVAAHVKKIYRKLGANSAASATLRAAQLGILDDLG
jgi:DNA-binding CsgD family transcriptional regulator